VKASSKEIVSSTLRPTAKFILGMQMLSNGEDVEKLRELTAIDQHTRKRFHLSHQCPSNTNCIRGSTSLGNDLSVNHFVIESNTRNQIRRAHHAGHDNSISM